jgi:hypothetical protein
MSTVQLPPEIEYKDSGYVARVVVFALMCFGCVISLLLWIGEVRRMLYACYPPLEITSLAVGGAQSAVQAYLSRARDATHDNCDRRPHAPAAALDERVHALRVHERADKRAPPAPTAAAYSFSKEVFCSSELWCLPAP